MGQERNYTRSKTWTDDRRRQKTPPRKYLASTAACRGEFTQPRIRLFPHTCTTYALQVALARGIIRLSINYEAGRRLRKEEEEEEEEVHDTSGSL